MKFPNFAQYEAVGRVLFGVINDAPGILLINGHIVHVHGGPGDPAWRILEILAKATHVDENGIGQLKGLTSETLHQIAEVAGARQTA